MIDIPAEAQILSTIKPGSVYYFVEDNWDTDIPHFFIVLKSETNSDGQTYLVVSSSKIDKVKQRCKNCPGTTVLISPEEYEGFSIQSIIDCNEVLQKPTKLIIDKCRSGDLKIKPEMEPDLIQRIMKAIKRSPKIDGILKHYLDKQ